MDEQEEEDLILEEDFALALVMFLTVVWCRFRRLCGDGITLVVRIVKKPLA